MCEMYMPPYSRGDLGEVDQLVGLGVARRRVDERGADAQRAFLHRRAHERLHALEFLGVSAADCRSRSRGRGRSSRRRTRRRSARRRVWRDNSRYSPSVVQSMDSLMSPCSSICIALRESSVSGPSTRLRRRPRASRPAGFRSASGRLRSARSGRPAQHVDEARRHRQAACVDFLRRAFPARSPIAAMRSPGRATSATLRRLPGAVVDGSAAQDHVVVRCGERRQPRSEGDWTARRRAVQSSTKPLAAALAKRSHFCPDPVFNCRAGSDRVSFEFATDGIRTGGRSRRWERATQAFALPDRWWRATRIFSPPLQPL